MVGLLHTVIPKGLVPTTFTDGSLSAGNQPRCHIKAAKHRESGHVIQ
jgi:hypothetical protein